MKEKGRWQRGMALNALSSFVTPTSEAGGDLALGGVTLDVERSGAAKRERVDVSEPFIGR